MAAHGNMGSTTHRLPCPGYISSVPCSSFCAGLYLLLGWSACKSVWRGRGRKQRKWVLVRQPAPQRGRGTTPHSHFPFPLGCQSNKSQSQVTQQKIECLPAGLSPLWLLGIFWKVWREKEGEPTPHTCSWLLKLSSGLSHPSTPLSLFSIPSSSRGLSLGTKELWNSFPLCRS